MSTLSNHSHVAAGLALPPTHADIELFRIIASRGQFEFNITEFNMELPPVRPVSLNLEEGQEG